MPASKEDVEAARGLFGPEGDITEYIVRLDCTVENTTWAEINAMHRAPGGRARFKWTWPQTLRRGACRMAARLRRALRTISRRPA